MTESALLPTSAYNIDQLFRRSTPGVVASLLVGFMFAYVMRPAVPHAPLLIWLTASSLLEIFRLLFAVHYLRARPSAADLAKYERCFLILAGIAATLWGMTGLLFFPRESPLHQTFTVILIAGHVAATTSTLSSLPKAYYIYVFPVTLPLLFCLFTFGDSIHTVMGIMVILFLLLMLKLSHMIYGYISEYRQAMEHEQSRSRTMELLADGAPLKTILTTIALDFEQRKPRALCSILLLDEAGEYLHTGAAPSLPDFFNDAFDGLQIGPGMGCCGTSAFAGERCVVEDIETHPHWRKHRNLAAKAGVQACWSQPILSGTGKVLGTFAIYHRQKERPTTAEIREIENASKLAEMAIERGHMQHELQLANMVYRNTGEAMIVTDAEDRVIAINPAFSNITGYRPEEIIGRNISVFQHGAEDQFAYQAMQESIRSSGRWQGEIWNVRKGGERFAEWLTVNTIFAEDGRVDRRVMLISDITEQKKSDELIWKQANYDALTGLPNRRLFRDRLELEIRKAHRAELKMAVLFLDLDRFKEVNDTLGHDAGDKLLVEAAQRLVECVRESDTVARLGGDEFIIVLSELDDSTNVERVAESIVRRLAEPFLLGEATVSVSASVGITLYPEDGEAADVLLKNADQAMYVAKNAGRDRFNYFGTIK
jgi:diguanylate cyclase (GGDEF)-like protein/PAS domain S-box-containing protein